MDDYSGPFRADFSLQMLSRTALADLAREYLLAGHLIDRAGLPQVLGRLGQDAMRDVSIDEWMGASPIYTARMRRALGFDGDDVATIFKGLQFDIGAPHQFMDFVYELESPDVGYFWLACCGALIDVEPMGDAMVELMCHDIEDPTFDATAVATNPRARIRPIHRPPRSPADREPHCKWRVFIDPTETPIIESPQTAQIRESNASTVQLPGRSGTEAGGWDDYDRDFDPDLQMEDLSHRLLQVVCEESCLQGHLIVRAFMMAVEKKADYPTARELATQQFTGVAGVTTKRLRSALGIEGDDAEAIAKILQVHPAFRPEGYVNRSIDVADDAVRFTLEACPALDEADENSWLALFGSAGHPALDCIVQTVNPRASCTPLSNDPTNGAWEITLDPTAEPASEPSEVTLTEFSSGAAFVFERRRALRV